MSSWLNVTLSQLMAVSAVALSTSTLYLVFLCITVGVLVSLLKQARTNMKAHQDGIDRKTFDMLQQLQHVVKNTKAMLDESHHALDEWRRADDQQNISEPLTSEQPTLNSTSNLTKVGPYNGGLSQQDMMTRRQGVTVSDDAWIQLNKEFDAALPTDPLTRDQ